MKIKVNKRLKITLISFFTLFIIISLYLLYKEVSIPNFTEQKTPVYVYNCKNSIDYDVFLKPNKLYDKNYLGEGMLYITEYVDYIRANLSYEFDGERSAEISGDYNIVAKVKGFIGEGEKLVNVWEKDFPIISHKAFKSNDTSASINEKVNLNLEEYNIFAKEIIETSKLNCDTTLNLIMTANLKVNTDKGLIEETITSDLVIPLNVSMFEISGNNVIEKPGTIEEIVQIQQPLDRNKIIILGIIIGILALALIYSIFFTVPSPIKDSLERELNKIFRKHGDRLVALNHDVEYPEDCINIVKTIDDLVRIADEVEEPIFYRYSENYKDIDKFYVIHEEKLYVLDLRELKSQKDGEEIVVENEDL
ncbi:DUF5305 domain-containing protein [Paratissierella segnis]|uniref:DUF5305 domain-containing protein n=1 Tax=Paratissierella segnis TaxID=2763679 RepID=A0A926IJE1_9FIRM|nr:DUF5305 domain-containing protein [Paratissierella segnis]MBC8587145.1 hypothetical protein [Paratissierella segnis]